MFGIEHHQPELFDLSCAKLRQQVGRRVSRIDELQPRRRAAKECSPPELDGGEHLRRFRRTHPVQPAQLVHRHPRHAVQAAGRFEDVICDCQRAAPARSIPHHYCDELVIAESGCAEPEQFFARTIVRRQGFYGHAILTLMSRSSASALFAAFLCSSVLSAGCATPPSREMDQAQGAIDAARAAGADRYATEQYGAAVKALQNAEAAVGQRDYRLALNYALDGRDRAQRAAKEAATQQAVLRSAAERRLSEVTASLDQARQRSKAAETARVPRRALAGALNAIAEAEGSLQKAGTSIQESNYIVSQEQLAESAKKLEWAMAEIEKAQKARGKSRR
jgi:hypothetical protein